MKKINSLTLSGFVTLLFLFATACTPETTQTRVIETIATTTVDGVTIYGEPYFGDLDNTNPLILLFHQGGSNGRGEYAQLTPWLNEAGFRAIAWDQRSGGETYGENNRTVDNLQGEVPTEYCDTYADLNAALNYVIAEHLAEQVIVWGSSYSAALVFRLAAEHPEEISGLLAFSPASGGPMVDCRARLWADEISVPMAVFRPASEMERESSVEQKDILEAAGASFHVIEQGIHGSSMLLDARTEHDMQEARAQVADWLSYVITSN